MMCEDIQVREVAKPDVEELLDFYRRQNHPTTGDRAKLHRMLENTFCFVTASRDGEMIGFARGVTDGLWGRLAECKLDPSAQGPACVTKQDGRIEHDTTGVAKRMALMIIDALEAYGVERIDAIGYGTEVDFLEELGFKATRGVVVMERTGSVEGAAQSAAASSGAR